MVLRDPSSIVIADVILIALPAFAERQMSPRYQLQNSKEKTAHFSSSIGWNVISKHVYRLLYREGL